ncbi:MAG TPA: hypothetical protein VLA74_08870 [Nitrososphaeraceae archaeon]|nr:hypothetical protein [Nitrososphaeraceae archaeon]
MYALRAKETIRQYPKRLKIFFDCGMGSKLSLEEQANVFYTNSIKNNSWTFLYFRKFIEYQKTRVAKEEITGTTIHNYYKVAKLFCKMNDIVINWDKLSKGLPPQKHYADDRGPTKREIEKLLQYPDVRIKPILLTMLSSGIRLGAWDYLRIQDVTPIKDQKGNVIAGKIIVYSGEHDQYTSLITPEAWFSIENWINYRKQHGEIIKPESMLMRDIWQTSERSYGAYFGLAKNPKKLQITGIKSLIERAIRSQDLLLPNDDKYPNDNSYDGLFSLEPLKGKNVKNGKRMRPWKSINGIRKTYKTITEQKMKPANIELLLGHKLGISSSYYKPNLERDILPDYLQVVDDLTINQEHRLKRENQRLQEKNQEKDYVINTKLQEKDEQIESIKKNYEIAIQSIRQEMEDKFQRIFSKIDVGKLS